MVYLHMTCGVVVIGFSLSLFWIRPFVPSLWNTSTCPFSILLVKGPWTHYSMLKSTCKFLLDWRWVCLLTYCLFCRRYSAKGTVVRKISVINKGLFHMIDDIFWNLGFKNETQADKVMMMIHIMCIIRLMCIIPLIHIFVLYVLYWLYR
jgi:hypothetical protein